MKRVGYILLLPVLTLSACSLVLDEYDDPQERVNLEEVGFDEPYTQKTEFGDITFQYADNTEVLREEALDYLVKVEDDSVLYFTDNIPQRLLVPEGKYVSMGCKEQLPHGLCSEVLSLTHENGMYRMVTSRRTYGEVFKQMDIDIFVDYDQQTPFFADEYLEEQGMINERGDTDSVFTDWALFGHEVVERKTAEVNRRIQERIRREQRETRFTWPWEDEEVIEGDEPDKDYKPTDESFDTKKQTQKDTKIFKISTSRLRELFKMKPGTGDWKGEMEMTYHEKTTLRHIQKVSNGQDYVKDIYDETPSMTLGFSIGWENSLWASNESPTLKKFYDKLYDASLGKKEKSRLNCKTFMIHIPIPVVTVVELFIRIDPSIELKCDVVGEFAMTLGLGETHKEVEYEKGKLIYQNIKTDKEKNSSWTVDKFDICGHFEAEAKVEILAGLATTGGLIGLGAGFDLGAKCGIQITIPFDAEDGGSFNVYLTPKVKAFGKSPGGSDWGSIEFTGNPLTLFGPVKLPIMPKFVPKAGSFALNRYDGSHTSAIVKARIQVTDWNLLKRTGAKYYTLSGGIFRHWGPGSEDLDYVGEAPAQSVSLTKKEYEFTVEDSQYKDGVYYSFRPYLNYTKGGNTFVTDDSDVICKLDGEDSEYPQLSFLKFIQTNYEKTKDEFEVFKVRVRVNMQNIQKQENWKEWGVELEAKGYFRENGSFRETLLEKTKFPVSTMITKNNVVLNFTLKSPGDEDVDLTALVYYTDKDGKDHYVHMRNTNDETIRLSDNMDDWGTDVSEAGEQTVSL